MNNFSLYLFDLDGTLLDSKEDIAIAVNYGLEKVGLGQKPVEDIVKFVGYGAKKLIEDLLPDHPQEIKDQVLEHFRQFYTANPVIRSTLYEASVEVLESLKQKGKKTAVVTNKYESISVDILKHFGILDLVDLVVGADTTAEKKPSPVPVLYAVEKLGQQQQRSIMIGDSETDILAGKNAGTYTCLVLHGYGNKQTALSLNPDFVIQNFKEFEV